MRRELFGRRSRRSKSAVSAIVGGILLFGIIFTVGSGYFYTVAQDQKILSVAQNENSNLWTERNQENMYIITNLSSTNILSFTVGNTGISTDVEAFFVTNSSGSILNYTSKSLNSGTSCSSSQALPCVLNAGSSVTFTPEPPIKYTSSALTVKVVTSRGSTFVGNYPTKELTTTALTSLVASGLGSLEMRFSTFNFYTYSELGTPNYVVNLTSGQTAAVTPFNKYIVFSAQITNNNPDEGTIVVNAHTDLWTFLSCGTGCGKQSLLGFYVMNVAANGTVTSTSEGSFVPIRIPYGETQTVYFGSACDLSIDSCGKLTAGYNPQSISDYMSEHDVFMIFSGTLVSPNNSTLYSQNLPFSATFTSDNIAAFSQSPTRCSSNTSSIITLNVTNSEWSLPSNGIYQVVVNASAFNVPYTQPTAPSGWNVYAKNGIITWNTTSEIIPPGYTVSFEWNGTSPSVQSATQYVFPSTVYWNSGTSTIQTQPIDTGCYVS